MRAHALSRSLHCSVQEIDFSTYIFNAWGCDLDVYTKSIEVLYPFSTILFRPENLIVYLSKVENHFYPIPIFASVR